MRRNARDDRGAVRMATTFWLAAMIAVIGVVGFNAASIMSSRVSTENDAQTAAYAASQAWHTTPNNLDNAYQAAVTAVAGKGEKVLTKGFVVDPDGTVHLVLRSQAKSILLTHIGSLRHLTVTIEHGDANSLTG
jgi:hypothetical protein